MGAKTVGVLSSDPISLLYFRGALDRAIESAKNRECPVVFHDWNSKIFDDTVLNDDREDEVFGRLKESVEDFIKHGSEIVGISFDVPQKIIGELRKAVPVKVISIFDSVANYLSAMPANLKRIGLITSEAVYCLEIYDRLILAHGAKPIHLNAGIRRLLEEEIKRSAGASEGRKTVLGDMLKAALGYFVHAQVDIVLVCQPKFPKFAVNNGRVPFEIVNSIDIFAREILSEASRISRQSGKRETVKPIEETVV